MPLESPAFVQPHSIEQAVEALDAYGPDARIVAGATAVSIMLRQRLIRPSALISIGDIPDLDSIVSTDGHLRLGALATHRQVELSPLVRERIPVLAQVFGVVANVRVRNAATVGGVVAEADYASDPPAVLLALDAQIEAVGPSGVHTIPAADFFLGFYETALAPNEIVTGVVVPVPPPETRGTYIKYVTRSSEDRPCVGVCACVRNAPDTGECAEVRIAVGAAAEVPRRFPDLEAMAQGTKLEPDVIAAIADGYAERIETLSDMRGSAWYRTEMIRVWVRRALEQVQ